MHRYHIYVLGKTIVICRAFNGYGHSPDTVAAIIRTYLINGYSLELSGFRDFMKYK